MPVLLDSLRNSVGELQLQSGFGDHLSRDFLQGEIDILISTDRIEGVHAFNACLCAVNG